MLEMGESVYDWVERYGVRVGFLGVDAFLFVGFLVDFVL